MALQFPNQSRSFDDVKQTVRFHGYDGMFEVRFVIEASALVSTAGVAAEEDCLSAFDSARSTIQDAAIKAYKRTHRSGYTLTAGDLK